MVDLQALASRARRAAEWGRLRTASRLAWAVALFALLALAVSSNRAAVVGVSLTLVAVTIGLGSLNAEAARAARSGLQLGAIPMIAGLLTITVEGWCDPNRSVTVCGIGCLLAGLFAGGAGAWYAVRTQAPSRLRVWSEIGLVASLTAALGCVGLGLGSALAVLGAMAAGAAVTWLPALARNRSDR
jgi:hypothetical protein